MEYVIVDGEQNVLLFSVDYISFRYSGKNSLAFESIMCPWASNYSSRSNYTKILLKIFNMYVKILLFKHHF